MLRFLLACLLGISVAAHAAHDPTQFRKLGPDSDTMIYAYTSPDCPHCRDWHRNVLPDLIKQFVNTKRAQIIFVDVAHSPQTKQAALLLRCLAPQKAQKMMGWLFENQNKWNNDKYERTLYNYVRSVGMAQSTIEKCLHDQEFVDEVVIQILRQIQMYQVQGWPTIALRRGNVVRLYSGTDRKAILNQMERDLHEMIENEKANK